MNDDIRVRFWLARYVLEPIAQVLLKIASGLIWCANRIVGWLHASNDDAIRRLVK